MFYSKETLFAEFDVATKKDQSKKKEIYDNRIQFFKDHIELRKTNPQYYDGVDINLTNLLEAWSAPNPRDHFYMKVFGKTYAEKMAESELEKSEKVTLN
tara:strand:+ start:134 stop:430 length:297 start_codon:yes stop_codon:yes gene_type:complete